MRDHEMLRLIARGATRAQAAAELGLSCRTVEKHHGALMDKLGVRDAAGLMNTAVSLRLGARRPAT
jgi:DNA-binding NarL/FixJ family response regulator